MNDITNSVQQNEKFVSVLFADMHLYCYIISWLCITHEIYTDIYFPMYAYDGWIEERAKNLTSTFISVQKGYIYI